MSRLRSLISLRLGLAGTLLAFLCVASVTDGALQEFCATVGYIGLGIAVPILFIQRFLERRS